MVIVEFDGLDGLTQDDAAELVQELAAEGIPAEIAQRGTPLGAVDAVEIVQSISVMSMQVSGAIVILRHALNSLKRGVVVDMTGDQTKISPARSLPRGAVLLKKPDGEVEFTNSDPLQGVAQTVVETYARLRGEAGR